MKKIIFIAMLLMAMAAQSWAAGACTQTTTKYRDANTIKVSFVCTGDGADGTIPTTAISSATITTLTGAYYLYTVAAYPTSGGAAPDAASVFIMDANGEDLLGSADGGTTAKNGLNLIHATLKKTTFPYSDYLGQSYFPMVVGALSLKVSGQSTVSANYTIDLLFVR